ncbi:hypothetical protein DS2_16339 [Catenovulum agarivorans DS-2]|uniref:Uncharacterized protein n=1 Tax=Catenovulum agarivorans DS-2 TaxID=1328313 RepID=W7Q7C0_9ALTE|nr:hypothetical protein [Catenovulum agarivorans]EWH08664.1 hypothetical protein DS2_16339 [Catenovulum agarivorans DS-2]
MVDFFAQQQDFAQDSKRLLAYAQLCNVFYERELKLLAEFDLEPPRLSKRLAALPFYIKRAAESLLSLENPLQLDTQNGTWSGKQKRRNPAEKLTDEQIATWLDRYAQIGLIVPVLINDNGITWYRLDCIDAISEGKLRLNEHGWFGLDGACIDNPNKRIVKANKETMTAACCGHSWIGGDITFPRTLTLRELLLSSTINWANLHKPLKIPH